MPRVARHTRQLNMRLSPEQLEKWEAQARAEDLPLAAWIRRTLQAALPRSVLDEIASPTPGRRPSRFVQSARYAKRQGFKP